MNKKITASQLFFGKTVNKSKIIHFWKKNIHVNIDYKAKWYVNGPSLKPISLKQNFCGQLAIKIEFPHLYTVHLCYGHSIIIKATLGNKFPSSCSPDKYLSEN